MVSFKNEDSLGNPQIFHHNELSPVNDIQDPESDDSSNDSGSDTGIELAPNEQIEKPRRPYPLRSRRQRQQPGMIPWDSIQLKRGRLLSKSIGGVADVVFWYVISRPHLV